MVDLPKTSGRLADQRDPAGGARRAPSRCAAGSRVAEGRSFTPGLDEVIVGRRLRRAHAGHADRGHASSTSRSSFQIVGVFDSAGRRLRERDLGRLRHRGRDLPARGGLELPGRAHEGRRGHPGPRPLASGPSRRCSSRRSRSGKYYEDQAGPLASILASLATFVAFIMGGRRGVRGHEHDVRHRGRAHPRDRHPAGAGLLAARDPALLRRSSPSSWPSSAAPWAACWPAR